MSQAFSTISRFTPFVSVRCSESDAKRATETTKLMTEMPSNEKERNGKEKQNKPKQRHGTAHTQNGNEPKKNN